MPGSQVQRFLRNAWLAEKGRSTRPTPKSLDRSLRFSLRFLLCGFSPARQQSLFEGNRNLPSGRRAPFLSHFTVKGSPHVDLG